MSLMSVGVLGCASPEWCDVNSPFELTEKEWNGLEDERKRTILVHNEYGADLCGWVPGGEV